MIISYEHRRGRSDHEYEGKMNLHKILEGKDFHKIINNKINKRLLYFDIFIKKEYTNKIIENQDEYKYKYRLKTSYFIGVDWVVENGLSIYIQPKLNNKEIQIDYLTMLFEALKEPENLGHLKGLLEVNFSKPTINIDQKEDILSPFLIVQFIQILHHIVQKGLRKTYYKTEKNLEARIKGKILVNKTVKNNVFKGKNTKTYCQFDEFGINNDENKILKKALIFSERVLREYKLDTEGIFESLNYIVPAFNNVSDDIDTYKINFFKTNPIYKEYEQALKLAQAILKRFSYNIDTTSGSSIETPPFWVDMSKLFELYVFKKLRDIFPKDNEVQYHVQSNYQEIDFLINSIDEEGNDFKMVVDAKYKPRYKHGNVDKEDIRQVCGYSRMDKVYEEFKLDRNQNIDCLIIYSHQDCKDKIEIDDLKINPEKNYVNFYKIGIKLPEIKKSI